MPRGRDLLDEYARRLQEDRDQHPLVTRCAWCDWTHDGTLADGRQAALDHRNAQHPERMGKQRTGQRPAMLPDQDVLANIAAVRAQGGAVWVEAA